jgi:hypothetical protein
MTMQILTSTTAGTSYSPTAGTTGFMVECVGGGGGGGGAVGVTNGTGGGGGGGGGGGYGRRVYTSLNGFTFTYSAGTAGAGGSGSSAGTAGGNTLFSDGTNTLTCKGGSGGNGVTATTAATTVIGAGGAGAAVSTGIAGDLLSGGDAGTPGTKIGNGVYLSGHGASSHFGGGALGLVNTVGAGTAAANYGAGGSGAAATNSLTAVSGGNGSQGVVIITEFK